MAYGQVVAEVLIVEDDATIRAALIRAFQGLPHVTVAVGTALEGLQVVAAGAPDVVLLDLGLPDLDGGSLLPMIRAVSQVPVIVISARDDERSMVRLLDAGADDYVVKPFSPTLLDARIRAVLRRRQTDTESGPVVVGDLVIDGRSRGATLTDADLELSPKEFDLLLYLAERVGEVISKRSLAREVWNQPYGGSDKTIDVHLHWLRRKLGESADAPRYIHRVRGVGVKLIDPTP